MFSGIFIIYYARVVNCLINLYRALNQANIYYVCVVNVYAHTHTHIYYVRVVNVYAHTHIYYARVVNVHVHTRIYYAHVS